MRKKRNVNHYYTFFIWLAETYKTKNDFVSKAISKLNNARQDLSIIEFSDFLIKILAYYKFDAQYDMKRLIKSIGEEKRKEVGVQERHYSKIIWLGKISKQKYDFIRKGQGMIEKALYELKNGQDLQFAMKLMVSYRFDKRFYARKQVELTNLEKYEIKQALKTRLKERIKKTHYGQRTKLYFTSHNVSLQF